MATRVAAHDMLVGAFLQALALLGWTIDRNVRIDTRWATTNASDIGRHAAELVALAPDVILASGSPVVGPLLQVTGTEPIVFVQVIDPSAPAMSQALFSDWPVAASLRLGNRGPLPMIVLFIFTSCIA